MTLPWRGDPQVLARCLVPLPLPPTPSPLSWRLFRLHHLLSRTPTKCLYFTATEPLLRVVVSSSLFIPPSPREESVCMCVLLPFLRPSLFLPSPLLPLPDNQRSPSFSPLSSGFYLSPRAPITRLCFFAVSTAFFFRETASSLGCTVHRYSYGTLFAFLPFFSLFRFLALSLHANPSSPAAQNEKETRLRDSRFRYRALSFFLSSLVILGNIALPVGIKVSHRLIEYSIPQLLLIYDAGAARFTASPFSVQRWPYSRTGGLLTPLPG